MTLLQSISQHITYATWDPSNVLPDSLFYYTKFSKVRKILYIRQSPLHKYFLNPDLLFFDWFDKECMSFNVNPFAILVYFWLHFPALRKKVLVTSKELKLLEDSVKVQNLFKDYIHQFTSTFMKFSNLRTQPKILVDGGLLILQPKSVFTSVLYTLLPYTGSPQALYSNTTSSRVFSLTVYSYWYLWRKLQKKDLFIPRYPKIS